MLCPPHDAVHTLTSRPRQDRFGGHQRREPASRHRQSSGCAVIWARQGCSAQRLSAARQRERKEEKQDIAQMRSRPRLIPMKFIRHARFHDRCAQSKPCYNLASNLAFSVVDTLNARLHAR